MKCDKILEKFLTVETYKKLPIAIQIHIFFCPRCKNEITRLQNFLESLPNTLPFDMPEDRSEQIMEEIKAMDITFHRHPSPWNWILVGVLMLVGTLLISYSDVIHWAKSCFGRQLDISLHLTMGFAVSIYIGVFIGIYVNEIKNIKLRF